MNLLETILGAAGGGAVSQIAKQFGLGEGSAKDIISQLAPVLARSMQKNTEQPGGMDALANALQNGNHSRYVDDVSSIGNQSTLDDGNAILGHLLGTKDVSRKVASHAAEQTGVDSSIIKKILPMVASLAMGALSKQTVGNNLTREAGGSSGGGLLAAFLDTDKDGSVLDDVLSLAGRFLR